MKLRFVFLALIIGALTATPASVMAASTSEELNTESRQALDKLTSTNALAKDIAAQSKAVLIFPNIVKAGLVFGGAYGEGVLFKDGLADSYYNTITASWGLQAGAQSYGYVVFLMNDKALDYLRQSQGWEIGVGPSVVIVNEGVAKNLSSTTLKDDAYAFISDQQGLMAAVSIEGTKITKIRTP